MPSVPFRRSLIATSLVCAVSAHASHLELEQIHVSDTPSTDPTAPALSERRAELDKVAGAVGTVDSETYKNGRSSNLKDVLGMATGVYIQPRFGAEEARLSIRGSGLQRTFHGRGLLLLQDARRSTTPMAVSTSRTSSH